MKTNTLPAGTLTQPVHFLAFGFGAGVSPYAPGTAGTLIAIPVLYLMHFLSMPLYLLLTIVLFVAGIWICGTSARRLGVHDHPGIVFDEIVGYLVTMAAVPFHWFWIVTGFLLFRLFDIWKPWPIGFIDKRLKGGLGIMLDDIQAGIYAWMVIQLIIFSGIWNLPGV